MYFVSLVGRFYPLFPLRGRFVPPRLTLLSPRSLSLPLFALLAPRVGHVAARAIFGGYLAFCPQRAQLSFTFAFVSYVARRCLSPAHSVCGRSTHSSSWAAPPPSPEFLLPHFVSLRVCWLCFQPCSLVGGFSFGGRAFDLFAFLHAPGASELPLVGFVSVRSSPVPPLPYSLLPRWISPIRFSGPVVAAPLLRGASEGQLLSARVRAGFRGPPCISDAFLRISLYPGVAAPGPCLPSLYWRGPLLLSVQRPFFTFGFFFLLPLFGCPSPWFSLSV